MEQPVLDLLEANTDWLDGGDRGKEGWREDIERFTPGYLEMEGAGDRLATDYDHSRFPVGEYSRTYSHQCRYTYQNLIASTLTRKTFSKDTRCQDIKKLQASNRYRTPADSAS